MQSSVSSGLMFVRPIRPARRGSDWFVAEADGASAGAAGNPRLGGWHGRRRFPVPPFFPGGGTVGRIGVDLDCHIPWVPSS